MSDKKHKSNPKPDLSTGRVFSTEVPKFETSLTPKKPGSSKPSTDTGRTTRSGGGKK